MNIEEHIRRAIEDGQFENLPGKGKPLNLDENSIEDPEWRLANKILKDGGFSLPWIENRREIEEGLASARADLSRAWAWREKSLSGEEPADSLEAEWKRAEAAFRGKVITLNKKIFNYNLEVPSINFQRMSINVEKEIEQAKGWMGGAEDGAST
jgi:DnaJ homolog subfamily C member 28